MQSIYRASSATCRLHSQSRRVFVFSALAICGVSAVTRLLPPAGAAERNAMLDELRKSFTVEGKPIPPEVFRDFGDGDMADSGSIRVTIDVSAAIGSNLYFDDIKVEGKWISQTKEATPGGLAEVTSYTFVGTTRNNLLVAIASYSSGGSGVFYTLHILDAAVARAFDDDGKVYDRLNVTVLRNVALGDRWDGAAKISGDAITVTTNSRSGEGAQSKPTITTVEARRP
jgi:hypothetical protein